MEGNFPLLADHEGFIRLLIAAQPISFCTLGTGICSHSQQSWMDINNHDAWFFIIYLVDYNKVYPTCSHWFCISLSDISVQTKPKFGQGRIWLGPNFFELKFSTAVASIQSLPVVCHGKNKDFLGGWFQYFMAYCVWYCIEKLISGV